MTARDSAMMSRSDQDRPLHITRVQRGNRPISDPRILWGRGDNGTERRSVVVHSTPQIGSNPTAPYRRYM